MRHFPIFVDVAGRRIVVSGAGETAAAKLRLLLKSEAKIAVYGADPAPEVRTWAADGRIVLTERPIGEGDAICAALLYAANDAPDEDARAARIGRRAGAQVNIVDNLGDSDFITPAIVDRDPVTVAIGTEGAAPVLARRIKAQVEEMLPSALGVLARIGQAARSRVEALPKGRARRDFWSRFYDRVGPRAFASDGAAGAARALDAELEAGLSAVAGAGAPAAGRVEFIGAGPGDPELLTLRARRLLHEADVVVYDRLAATDILELARREARMIDVGKTPYGPSWRQDDINAVLVREAREGAVVARLKSGDPGVFGRLDEEIEALVAAEIAYAVTPGVTAAASAAAAAGVSLTRRGRNHEMRLASGHDAAGFAEQDWRGLSRPGAVAAIYMGVRAASFIRGRLLMHGAAPETPVTVVENASRAEQKIVSASLADLPEAMAASEISGPATLLIGLAPRAALAAAAAAAGDAIGAPIRAAQPQGAPA